MRPFARRHALGARDGLAGRPRTPPTPQAPRGGPPGWGNALALPARPMTPPKPRRSPMGCTPPPRPPVPRRRPPQGTPSAEGPARGPPEPGAPGQGRREGRTPPPFGRGARSTACPGPFQGVAPPRRRGGCSAPPGRLPRRPPTRPSRDPPGGERPRMEEVKGSPVPPVAPPPGIPSPRPGGRRRAGGREAYRGSTAWDLAARNVAMGAMGGPRRVRRPDAPPFGLWRGFAPGPRPWSAVSRRTLAGPRARRRSGGRTVGRGMGPS